MTFLSNAGAVVILRISGSFVIVASGMALIMGGFIISELVAQCFTGNPFLLAIAGAGAGAGLANGTSQVTFPYFPMIFLLQIWVAIAFIALIQRADSFPLYRRRPDAVPD